MLYVTNDKGLAAVLEAGQGLSSVQREHLRTIISSGEDLLGLINNILDHSRLESGSVTLERIPFSLRDVVEVALDTVAAVAQNKGLELCLISSFENDPPGLRGDPFRIKQVLLNLMSNAVKFTASGSVTVEWRWHEVGEGRIKIVLDVRDTGIGIPAQSMLLRSSRPSLQV
jgi:signal transduction histidine kinase